MGGDPPVSRRRDSNDGAGRVRRVGRPIVRHDRRSGERSHAARLGQRDGEWTTVAREGGRKRCRTIETRAAGASGTDRPADACRRALSSGFLSQSHALLWRSPATRRSGDRSGPRAPAPGARDAMDDERRGPARLFGAAAVVHRSIAIFATLSGPAVPAGRSLGRPLDRREIRVDRLAHREKRPVVRSLRDRTRQSKHFAGYECSLEFYAYDSFAPGASTRGGRLSGGFNSLRIPG